MQGLVDQLGHALVIDRARLAGPKFIVKPIEPVLEVALAPLAHRGAVNCSRLAIALSASLAAAASTMRARATSEAGIDRERAMAVNSIRSGSLSTKSAFASSLATSISPPQRYRQRSKKYDTNQRNGTLSGPGISRVTAIESGIVDSELQATSASSCNSLLASISPRSRSCRHGSRRAAASAALR